MHSKNKYIALRRKLFLSSLALPSFFHSYRHAEKAQGHICYQRKSSNLKFDSNQKPFHGKRLILHNNEAERERCESRKAITGGTVNLGFYFVYRTQ